MLAVDFVSVPYQVAWNAVFGESFDHLLSGQGSGRILGHVKVNYAPAVMGQDDQNEQDAERGSWNGEEVSRDQLFQVVVQKRPPGLRGWFPPPGQKSSI
jgi:hypothetical protein